MREVFHEVYGQYDSLAGRVFGPLVQPRTYLRTLHLLLMFPLGLAYFVALAVTFSVGGALIWTFVGPIVLIVALFFVRWSGDLEAQIIRYVGRLEIRRPPTRLEQGLTWWQQVTTRLIDPTTWTGLLYLLVQFPVGVASFAGLVALYTISVSFIAAPAIVALSGPTDLKIMGAVLDTPVEAAALIVPGVFVLVLTTHLSIIASAVHARWARRMLGSRARRSGESTAPDPQPPLIAARMSVPESAALLPPAPGPSAEPLTAREVQVLGLLARGYSNADIAEELVISEGTVKTHVKHVLAKLPAANRTEAAFMARSFDFDPGNLERVDGNKVVHLRVSTPELCAYLGFLTAVTLKMY